MTDRPTHIVCAYCERSISVNRDGKVRKHGKCRGSGRPEAGFQRSPVEEAAIVCKTCAPGHPLGSLQPRCGVHGCECWCNR
jgi:hypothetical protein